MVPQCHASSLYLFLVCSLTADIAFALFFFFFFFFFTDMSVTLDDANIPFQPPLSKVLSPAFPLYSAIDQTLHKLFIHCILLFS